ncbi:MAG: hypothetical protein L6R42_008951 [Xanthoria sp. 1 TBL-2021]|nr:MAG: hypothetical protein L6R42_008951 [Xanthoria sp. 1 TBL-2021]
MASVSSTSKKPPALFAAQPLTQQAKYGGCPLIPGWLPTPRTKHRWLVSSIQDITRFYVNQNGDIDCIEFSASGPFNGGCSIRENSANFPRNVVAAESTQISATMLMPAGLSPGLLLVYEEPSGTIAIILGYM